MKKLYTLILLLLFCQSIIFSNPYKLSPDYRPVKLTIYWVGFNESREHIDYEYNKKGQLMKTSTYRGEDSPSWYSIYEYDEANRLIKKSTYSSAGLNAYTTLTYVNNNLYEEAEFNKEGVCTQSIKNEYDKNGNIISISIKQTPYGGTYLSWSSLEFFMYDSEQKVIESLEYYDSTLENRTSYTYNKDNFIMNIITYGDNHDTIGKTVKSFKYLTSGKNKGKLEELINNRFACYDGKEEIECCTTYTMKPEYESQGNMTKLIFYNCENVKSGYAVVTWEKGKTDMELIKKIFEQIHWYFTGC
ncbi:MAG: hypothetical protein JXB88_04300 [Spirochaetales bacterium]|nr:hypothetical protein [Spirochaetales bacterium]